MAMPHSTAVAISSSTKLLPITRSATPFLRSPSLIAASALPPTPTSMATATMAVIMGIAPCGGQPRRYRMSHVYRIDDVVQHLHEHARHRRDGELQKQFEGALSAQTVDLPIASRLRCDLGDDALAVHSLFGSVHDSSLHTCASMRPAARRRAKRAVGWAACSMVSRVVPADGLAAEQPARGSTPGKDRVIPILASIRKPPAENNQQIRRRRRRGLGRPAGCRRR